MRYYAGVATGSQRPVMDAPKGGSVVGVAFAYGVMPMPSHWYRIVLRGTDRPTVVPGKWRIADGEFTLIEGTEAE